MKRLLPLMMVVGLWAALWTNQRAWGGATCMTGSPAATASCIPGTTYGVSVGASSVPFLSPDPDGARNCIQLFAQPTNAANVCIAFQGTGPATATMGPPPNCMSLVPGGSYAVFNLPGGNIANQVSNSYLAAISNAGTANLTYMYCR